MWDLTIHLLCPSVFADTLSSNTTCNNSNPPRVNIVFFLDFFYGFLFKILKRVYHREIFIHFNRILGLKLVIGWRNNLVNNLFRGRCGVGVWFTIHLGNLINLIILIPPIIHLSSVYCVLSFVPLKTLLFFLKAPQLLLSW